MGNIVAIARKELRSYFASPSAYVLTGFFALIYGFFFGTFLYAMGFVDGLVVPKHVDTGTEGPLIPTLAVNGALLAVFAIQHSVMARPGFKAWWTKIVPGPVERSTYVLLASLALILLFWQWRPLPQTVFPLVEADAGQHREDHRNDADEQGDA